MERKEDKNTLRNIARISEPLPLLTYANEVEDTCKKELGDVFLCLRSKTEPLCEQDLYYYRKCKERRQENLLAAYRRDMSKYSDQEVVDRLRKLRGEYEEKLRGDIHPFEHMKLAQSVAFIDEELAHY